jgi:hypothetical protein
MDYDSGPVGRNWQCCRNQKRWRRRRRSSKFNSTHQSLSATISQPNDPYSYQRQYSSHESYFQAVHYYNTLLDQDYTAHKNKLIYHPPNKLHHAGPIRFEISGIPVEDVDV